MLDNQESRLPIQSEEGNEGINQLTETEKILTDSTVELLKVIVDSSLDSDAIDVTDDRVKKIIKPLPDNVKEWIFDSLINDQATDTDGRLNNMIIATLFGTVPRDAADAWIDQCIAEEVQAIDETNLDEASDTLKLRDDFEKAIMAGLIDQETIDAKFKVQMIAKIARWIAEEVQAIDETNLGLALNKLRLNKKFEKAIKADLIDEKTLDTKLKVQMTIRIARSEIVKNQSQKSEM